MITLDDLRRAAGACGEAALANALARSTTPEADASALMRRRLAAAGLTTADTGDQQPARCQCGGDMPGRCPGPHACPMVDDRAPCRVCGERTRHRQDFDDTWICDECEENEE